MSRSCWVGSLSFGLVHLPVRLYAAVEPKQVQFHLLHDADGARVQQKRVCSADGEEVPYEHVVKGYELRRGQYVEVTRGELEAFDPKSSRTIELEDFVELGEIDPMFYAGAFHLVPEVGAERQYGLLVEALRRSGRVGLGRLVMRHKGHLCVVRPYGRGLALSTLHYADEMVSQDTLPELAVAGPRPNEQELQMVQRLIESQSTSFEPRRYNDTHRERLLSFLERRARAQSRIATPEPSREQEASPEELEGRAEVFRRIEEGIAALRQGLPKPHQAGRALPSQGSLRFRPMAAKEARERRQVDPGAVRSRRGKGEPKRS
ncbi:Ku protein [Hyalangium rubrum]|uniref:Non-homologous end joining protein Ku n=1 Tax=Hyalangium rubrum TaxID=3103134 RepID=A0ABU5HF20_9BACT|nr:Ku protein [Hyalangium sp. s54d21]MDY7231956.1 Ku protein [Hyalangium sp. s54d21]